MTTTDCATRAGRVVFSRVSSARDGDGREGQGGRVKAVGNRIEPSRLEVDARNDAYDLFDEIDEIDEERGGTNDQGGSEGAV